MAEFYTYGERAIIFSIVFAFCFITSLIFLIRRSDFKIISFIIFAFCLIYSSFFLFLNMISMYDVNYGNTPGFEKFSKTISIFYFIFSLIDKILGFGLINIYISYIESGYYNKFKKIFDFIIRKINNVLKLGKIKLIVIASIILVLLVIFFVLLIHYKDHFEITNTINYFFILLDCYAVFEIYTNVGFFIIQIFIDYKRNRDIKLIKRYYRYSIIKIIEKTESYIKKINNSQKILDEEVKKLAQNDKSEYNKYIKETLKEIEEQINILELEGNSENLNEMINIDINNNYDINNNNYDNNSNYMNNNHLNNNNYMDNYIYNSNNYMNNNNYFMYNNNYMDRNLYMNNNNYFNQNYLYNGNNYLNANYIYNSNNYDIQFFHSRNNENSNVNLNNRFNGINYLQNNHRQNERKIRYEEESIKIQSNEQNKETKRKINKIQKENKNKNENKEENKGKKEEKKDNVPTSIRKFKKSVRRISKLKKLYKEIQKETKNDLSKINENKKCKCSLYCVFFFMLLL